jgi:hypothetical protein
MFSLVNEVFELIPFGLTGDPVDDPGEPEIVDELPVKVFELTALISVVLVPRKLLKADPVGIFAVIVAKLLILDVTLEILVVALEVLVGVSADFVVKTVALILAEVKSDEFKFLDVVLEILFVVELKFPARNVEIDEKALVVLKLPKMTDDVLGRTKFVALLNLEVLLELLN